MFKKTYEFEIKSGEVIISDPCYRKGALGTLELNVKKGIWIGEIYISKEMERKEVRNGHISSIVVYHKNSGTTFRGFCWDLYGHINVDSGQAGIFDNNIYPDDDVGEYQDIENYKYEDMKTFYAKACYLTNNNGYGIIDKRGIVATSGYGDGRYEVFTIEADNKIIAIKIIFLWDD